jgi:diaminopropionate ammonia-lyase
LFNSARLAVLHRRAPRSRRAPDEREQGVLPRDGFDRAWAEITSWTDYAPTPLRSLPGLAARCGVGRLWYKDEGGRFGLGSFKALGGAYGVLRAVERELAAGGRADPARDRRGGRGDAAGAGPCDAAAITVTTATDGNHGRSVAWGARRIGCRAAIVLPGQVSAGREAAIRRWGAEVVRIAGDYDEAVRYAARAAAANGWIAVSDTSWEGYQDIPRDVMQGYRVMAQEVLAQLPERPTHVLVQGGVGALAAAVCLHFWEHWGPERPRFVVVEPTAAACLWASAQHGRPALAEGSGATLQAGLACREPSPLAWAILDAGAEQFVTIDDAAAVDAMRALAFPGGDDPPIVAGESAVAGVAALLEAARDAETARALGLDRSSRVLVFGTEGDTDPELYRELVGATAAEVRAGRPSSSPHPAS